MINKVILVGNLGADPEVRVTQGGKSVAELRVATTWGFGDKEETEWHRVVVWDKAAEASGKYLKKGSKVYVEGRIKQRQYQDKEGATRYITEVIANEVKFLSSKNDGAGSKAADVDADEPW